MMCLNFEFGLRKFRPLK